MPNECIAKLGDKVDTEKGQNTAEERFDTPREYAVHLVLRRVSESDKVEHIVSWKSFTCTDGIGGPLQHIPKHFIPVYWLKVGSKDARRHGQNT